jgi:hypothetical protein
MPNLRTSPDQHIALAAEAFKAGVLSTDPADLSPQARDIVRAGGPFSMSDLACTVLEMRHGPGAVPVGDPARMIKAALSTSDFPNILQETLKGITVERQSDLLEDLRAITRRVNVENYNERAFTTVDLAELPLPSSGTENYFFTLKPKAAGEPVRTFSIFAKLLVSVQALAADTTSFITAAVAAFANAAHRGEMKRIAELLEDNAALADGAPLFHADRGNLGTAGLSNIGLGEIASTLRSQPSESGIAASAPLHALIVHPDDEINALALVEALPMQRQPRVVSNAFLANNDYWYGMAPPEQYPTLGRVLLRDSDDSAVTIGQPTSGTYRDQDGRTVDFPGIHLDLTHTTGLTPLSAVGIAKFAKS